MNIVSHNLKSLMEEVKRDHSDNYAILKEFANSSDDCVKLEGWTHKNASSCAASMGASIRRFYRGQMKVIQRRGDVFLVKLEAMK